MKRIAFAIMAVLFIFGSLAACSPAKKEIIFADAGWDSIKLNNAIAGFIAETAFDYDWKEILGSSSITYEGLKKGEIDVYTEVWSDNLTPYEKDAQAGAFKVLGDNLNENRQGLYVPRYVIEGDPERGIEPMAPDLKSVEDLKKYKDLFPDDEQKGKGRIYGAIPGWMIDEVMFKKYEYYGLDKDYVYFRPGSEAAINAAFISAYEKGEPLVGYNWEPTWIMGKYDFVLLEDAEYDPEGFLEGKTSCPSVEIKILASNKFAESDPEYCEFLSKFSLTSQQVSQALAYMEETGADHKNAAIWFLENNKDLINQWLDGEKASLVIEKLK